MAYLRNRCRTPIALGNIRLPDRELSVALATASAAAFDFQDKQQHKCPHQRESDPRRHQPVLPTCQCFAMGPSGLEPLTSSLSGTRSNQLSYEPDSTHLRNGTPPFREAFFSFSARGYLNSSCLVIPESLTLGATKKPPKTAGGCIPPIALSALAG